MNVGVYGKENSRLILCKCVLSVCVSLSQAHCRGNRPCFVLGRYGEVAVWESVTQHIAAVTGTCSPLELDRQPARNWGVSHHPLSPSLNLSFSLIHTDVTSTNLATLLKSIYFEWCVSVCVLPCVNAQSHLTVPQWFPPQTFDLAVLDVLWLKND